MEIPRRRRSACADAALLAELERIGRMTIEERGKTALDAIRATCRRYRLRGLDAVLQELD